MGIQARLLKHSTSVSKKQHHELVKSHSQSQVLANKLREDGVRMGTGKWAPRFGFNRCNFFAFDSREGHGSRRSSRCPVAITTKRPQYIVPGWYRSSLSIAKGKITDYTFVLSTCQFNLAGGCVKWQRCALRMSLLFKSDSVS